MSCVRCQPESHLTLVKPGALICYPCAVELYTVASAILAAEEDGPDAA